MGLFGWPIGAVALGIAQGAIDEIMRVAQRKTPRLATSRLREQWLSQTQLAHAVALVSSARSWLHAIVSRIWERALQGEATFVERAEFLLAATNATRSSAAAVELAYTAGGGIANYRKSPLQRQLRD